jgi:hypothetical protein
MSLFNESAIVASSTFTCCAVRLSAAAKDSTRPVSVSSRPHHVRSSFHMINMAPGSNDIAVGTDVMKAPG